MSITTVAVVLGLALLDMLSPAIIGVSLYLLVSRPPGVAVLLAAYLGTVALTYFALGAGLMVGLSAVMPAIDPTLWGWGQGALGVILFTISWFIPARKNSEPVPPRTASLTLPSMVLLGLGTWLFEFYLALPYFAAIGIMTSANLQAAAWLPLLGAYVVIMILPGIALYLLWFFLRGRIEARFDRWQQKLGNGSRETLSWIVGIAGVLIFLDALPDQVSFTFS